MAEHISSLKASYPITIRGHYKGPYHKSLDTQIDKLLENKSNKVTTAAHLAVGVTTAAHLAGGVTTAAHLGDVKDGLNTDMTVFPLQTSIKGEAISPQAADVVDQVLGNVTKQHQPQQSEPESQSYHQSQGLLNISERLEDRGPGGHDLERNDTEENKQFENDSRNRYQFDSSNLSINSDEIDDIDREALEPERESPPQDYSSQKLPPSSYSSNFSAEEARLRYSLDYAHADLKERFRQFSNTQFNEEEWKRRFSLPDTKENANGFSLSNPPSPVSKSLSTSPLGLFRGKQVPRALEEPDYALTPRVKEGLYFCHLCSFSGTTQAEFDLHMTCHFEHVCPHCDYKSRTEGRLKRHIKDFHTDDGEFGTRTMPGRPKVFKCKQCDFSTTDKIEFWTHSRRHIKEDKLLQCPRCPFVTEYKHHLEYHLRNHFGSKPFKCPKCNYACVNKSMLNSHMKSHTNVYQYRCADCTYATKYCHSLKLHLRKYNHKPAAVLNSDGSLPQGMDATASGLSLLAKRGPPRGPRGPRKDKMDPMTGPFLQMGASPMNHLPQGMPGMMSPYWPLLHSQMPNGMQIPLGLGPRFNAHLPPLPSPRDNPVIKKEELPSPPGVTPLKCNFCSFIGNNREVLTSHVVKVHASENQDLFSMFGISSEALLEENHKRISALKSPLRSPRMFHPPHQLTPTSGLKIKTEAPDDVNQTSPRSKQELFPEKTNLLSKEPQSLPSFPFMNGGKLPPPEMRDQGIDILKQMTLKFGSGPVDLKAHGSAETPLDLTKPRYSPASLYSQQLNSLAEGQNMRQDEGENSSGENSNCSNGHASPTPRKRSRKGKAFKLDTLCLKLQEKKTSGANQSEEESVDDNDEMSPEIADDDDEREDYYHKQRENGEYVYKEKEEDSSAKEEEQIDVGEPEEDMNDLSKKKDITEEDGEIKQDRDAEAEIDFKKVHESLSMLNSQSDDLDHDDDLVIDEEKDGKTTENGETKIEDNKDEMRDTNQDFLKDSMDMPFYNKRKAVPPAIQRGTDIAWKMLNKTFLSENNLQNGLAKYGYENYKDNLKNKLHLENPDFTSMPEKHGSSPDYTCPHCQIAFGDCIMYTMHMGYHGYKDPYKCNMCGDLCKDRVEFFLHIARAAHN